MFGKPQGWYISYIPQPAAMYQLYTTAAAFDLRCESVTYHNNYYIPVISFDMRCQSGIIIIM